ncbi:hypothetical protein ACLKA7_008433 [Drosophila subpalustris]
MKLNRFVFIINSLISTMILRIVNAAPVNRFGTTTELKVTSNFTDTFISTINKKLDDDLQVAENRQLQVKGIQMFGKPNHHGSTLDMKTKQSSVKRSNINSKVRNMQIPMPKSGTIQPKTKGKTGNVELTISIPRFKTDIMGNWVYNPWGVTFGDQFRDTRFNFGGSITAPRMYVESKIMKNYYPNKEMLSTVCIERSSPYNDPPIMKWLNVYIIMASISVVSGILLYLCVCCVARRSWNFEILSIKTTSSDYNLMNISLQIDRISFSESSISGFLHLKYDADDKTEMELLVLSSVSGREEDYHELPYKTSKQTITEFVDNYYDDLVYANLGHCSNFPKFKGKFVPPFPKRNYTLNNCALTGDGFPDILPLGYYKIIVRTSGPVEVEVVGTTKAYFNPKDVKLPKVNSKSLSQIQAEPSNANECQANEAKSLRHLVLDAIVSNWSELPLYRQLRRREDRNYLLSQLDAQLPLQLLSSHIRDDFFWRRCYELRWRLAPLQARGRERHWINIYMERHVQEFIENMQTGDYEQDGNVQTALDICAAYINQLEINLLQPAPADSESNDHIPLDYLLSNLPDLRRLRLSYSTKTAGVNYQIGCNQLTPRDILLLAKGLSQCHELRKFCLHNTKLAAYQLKYLAHSLDKGCHHLKELSLLHCAVGDAGIRSFLETCGKESFSTLTVLDLTNNRITEEGAYTLSCTLRHVPLQRLVLRLNPIQSDGAAAIFQTLQLMPIRELNLGSCGISETITKLFMMLICQHKTLLNIDLSNNLLGEDFGKHLLKIIHCNKILEELDLRNTGLSLEMRRKFREFLLKNAERKKHETLKQQQRIKFKAMVKI